MPPAVVSAKPSAVPDTSSLITAASAQPTALLTEVFSSFQGEGLFVGERQLFVRFSHCHLHCRYCDTVMQHAHGQCVVHGNDDTEFLFANPISPQGFVALIRQQWATARHYHLSLTGGEPLLYHKLLAEALPELGETPVYLETSGTQPELLEKIAPWVDTVAMDIKLPSATGERFYVDEHQAFLSLCRAYGHTVFTKLVFNDSITDDEIATVIRIMGDATDVPVFLQPESHLEKPGIALSQTKLFAVADTLANAGLHVRVVPQTHKMLNVL